jgi:hypothetical protein
MKLFNETQNYNKSLLIKIFINFIFAVDDASGHYTTGFFYGNNYWTGSMPLCRSVYQTDRESSYGKYTIFG